jgi:hypothetical protein
MSEEIEHLDVGGSTHHPVLHKIMIASTGVAVGALIVSVGPGLLVGTATPSPGPRPHGHMVVLRATCTESRCHPWTVEEGQLPILVTHISPGPNDAVAMHYLTHESCP